VPLDTAIVLLALGLVVAVLAGTVSRRDTPHTGTSHALYARRGVSRTATPDDGPLGLGAGRTARCPVCAQTTLELIDVSTVDGHDVPHVRCGHCFAGFTVRGALTSVPEQRPAVG
jgi:hypothetical protein